MQSLDELIALEGDRSCPSEDDVRALAASVVGEANERAVTIGTAESCTGGLISGALTSVAGSSASVMGGVVSYACSVKQAILGVEQSVLDSVGAVSRECALQMSQGACRALDAQVCVAVTGIAGPGGAVPGKPVGTVWFSVTTPERSVAVRHLFSGNRDQVRAKTVATALELLRAGVVETQNPDSIA